MGHCISKISPESDSDTRSNSTKTKKRLTILILGTPSSGKSTIMRQFRILYGNGFSNNEKIAAIPTITRNLLESVSSRLSLMNQEHLEAKGPRTAALSHLLKIPDEDIPVSTAAKAAPKSKLRELALLVEDVWYSESLQDIFKDQTYVFGTRNVDVDGYFLKRIKEINSPSYAPTDGDLLRMRQVTDAVEEFKFSYHSCDVTVIDVGGTKVERRKWINLFSRANMIIYCASLVDYDLSLEEDNNTNSMNESLTVFESVVNLTYFKDTPLLLFLNKKDLLSKKVKAVPVNKTFPNYKGPDGDPHEVVGFIKWNFLHKIKDKTRPVKVHVTSATNTRDVKRAFEISLDWVLEVKK